LIKNDYTVNIVGTDNSGNIAVLSVEVNVETYNSLVSVFTKLTSSKTFGTVKVPYLVIFFILFILFSIIMSYIYKKAKMSGNVGFGVLSGLILSYISLIFI
jgi:asparagine N-glycosylation enzyme membrane subunit Stt3